VLHFSAELGRAASGRGGQEEPGLDELTRQADAIATQGAELTEFAPPEVKRGVDVVLKATAEAKTHLKPGDTHGAAAQPMYRPDTDAARAALDKYAPCDGRPN
jgi:hypothetical protein